MSHAHAYRLPLSQLYLTHLTVIWIFEAFDCMPMAMTHQIDTFIDLLVHIDILVYDVYINVVLKIIDHYVVFYFYLKQKAKTEAFHFVAIIVFHLIKVIVIVFEEM